MSRIFITIITVGAALVVAVPALGKGYRQDATPQWQQALEARSEGLNRQYGLGEYQRLDAQKWQQAFDGLRERFGLGTYTPSTREMLDRREASQTAKVNAQVASAPSPDAFDRAVVAAASTRREVVGDDRFSLHPQSVPTPTAATSSGRDIDVPQIGIGFGIGLLLALGTVLAVRYTRVRSVAH